MEEIIVISLTMIKVTLLGEIGEKFTREFYADVRSSSEVIECLQSNFEGFTRYLREAHLRGIGFVVKVGYQEITEELLNCPFAKRVKNFTISAVPMGQGGGIGKILLGVALIGVGLLSGGAGFLGISSTTLFLTGGAMVLSGIASLFGNNKNDKSKESKQSLLFGGGAQTTTEGSRIPIVYGKHKTGIFVLSARIYSYQLV